MNVTEFDIITNFTPDYVVPCETGIIAVTNNILCNTCGTISDFDPMISNGEQWSCLPCWSAESEDHVLSEHVSERLAEVTLITKRNYLIRNMSW